MARSMSVALGLIGETPTEIPSALERRSQTATEHNSDDGPMTYFCKRNELIDLL
jgi:hypothetical protein